MTDPAAETAVEPQRRSSLSDVVGAGESLIRQLGRDLIIGMYRALRSLKLYPVENEQVQKALDELTAAAGAVLAAEQELEVRVVGELLFVNATRLRLELGNYASFSHVLSTLRNSGIGVVHIEPEIDRREWQVFVAMLLSFAPRGSDPNKLAQLQQKLALGNVTHVGLEPPAEGEGEHEDAEKQKEGAKRTYERSIAVAREVVSSTRMGRSSSVKKIKRAVQGIVDQVLNNEVALVGLTTLRDYDDYTFTHSVNVCIFSLAIGKRLGLTKMQLFDLGMGALVHDLGKGRVPMEVLNKLGKFTPEEWHQMQSHTWLGTLSLFRLRGYGEIPYRSMISAYEHHMRLGAKGYPTILRERELSVYSKIIAVADTFDAATSARVYKAAKAADVILRELWEDEALGFDPVLVKALVNVLGIYPVGSCVLLDTHELGIVHAANSDVAQLHRPIVRVVCGADGAWLDPCPLVDLAETNGGGTFKRSIIKVADPERYGITPSDYFV